MSLLTLTQGDKGVTLTGVLSAGGVAAVLAVDDTIELLLLRDGQTAGAAIAGTIVTAASGAVAAVLSDTDLATPGLYLQQWRQVSDDGTIIATYSGSDGPVNWIAVLPRLAE